MGNNTMIKWEDLNMCKFCGDILPEGRTYCCKECYYEFEEIRDEEEED